jgi:hypothetical protein
MGLVYWLVVRRFDLGVACGALFSMDDAYILNHLEIKAKD